MSATIMKFLTSLAALAALVLLPLAVRADETPEKQLEFVRKLRAKGYNDLAVQYLDLLKKNPPPGLALLLPLEMARTKVSLARDKEPGQRLAMYAEARKELDNLVKANPNSPQSAQVRLEIARIASLQGNALLTQAFQQEDDNQADEFARKAQQQYAQAGTELDASVKALEAALKNLKGATDQEKLLEQQLTDDLMHARFERGRNYLDEAKTYLNTDKADVNRKRAETVDKGREILEAVATEDLTKSPETSYLAYAWLIRVYQQSQQPVKANDTYVKVMKARGKEVGAAQRWATYFHMQGIPEDKTLKGTGLDRLKAVKSLGEDWLVRYGAYRNAPEGQAVRFELATTLFKMAQGASPKDRKKAENVAMYKQAQTLLKSLTEGESDYSHRAGQLGIKISLDLMGSDTPTAQLKNFDECFLKAQFELARMQEVAAQLKGKAGDPKLEEQRKQHLRNTIEAFRRALRLATPKTPPAKLDEARFYLTVAYMMQGDPYRAAVQGEALAKQQPPSKRSPAAAGYALQAYAAILGRADENVDANRNRLRDLSDYILQTKAKDWKGESVVPIARYQLAMAYLRDKNHVKAVEHLEQIPPDFSAYIFAQCQLAFTALLARDDVQDEKQKAVYEGKALAALKRVASLPADTDPATAQMFFAAQLEQGKLLYKAGTTELKNNNLPGAVKKYQEMGNFCDGLLKQFKGLKTPLDSEPKANLEHAIELLGKYARFGVIDAEYRQGNFKKAVTDTEPLVQTVQKEGGGKGPIRMQDYKLTGDILGLAMRANVQVGDVNKAEKILDLLKRLTGQKDEINDPTAVLRSLLGELQVQIRELRAKGDQKKLEQTLKTFSSFIDVLAKQSGGKGLERNDVLFMANCYSSLEQHEKAAGLYAGYPEPKFDPAQAKDEKYLEDWKRDTQLYWLVKVFEAQELRKAKKIPEARKLLDQILDGDREEVKAALKAKVFTGKEPEKEAAPLLQAGKLLAEKERIHVLEDQEVYGKAVTEWGKFMQNPAIKGQIATNNKMKELYFETYYHYVYCWYKYSQSPKVKGTPKEQTFLERAANYIIGLENASNQDGWTIARPFFQELLRNEPTLNDAYQRLRQKNNAK